jgi:hypothetical protein
MKTIGSDNTYIDYWQDVATPLLKTQFGIRVREGRFSAIIKLGAEQPKVVSEIYPIPIKLPIWPGTLPTLISTIINHHVLHPNSDLIEVLKGKESVSRSIDKFALLYLRGKCIIETPTIEQMKNE